MDETATPSLGIDPNRSESHRRLAALMTAHREGWLIYVGPVDPDVTASRMEYTIIHSDREIALTAVEVLPYVMALAVEHGRPDLVSYRPGL